MEPSTATQPQKAKEAIALNEMFSVRINIKPRFPLHLGIVLLREANSFCFAAFSAQPNQGKM